MATTTASSNSSHHQPKTMARAGSAPPSRGYEKPVPHPSSRTGNGHHQAVIHSRKLPPKTPAGRSDSKTASQSKKRRMPVSTTNNSTPCGLRRDDKMNNGHHCSMAMSRTESILVSSGGDVIVCRCRRSSTPFIPTASRDPMDVWNKQFPCCDTDLLSSIDGPWSPVLENLTTQKSEKIKSANQTTTSEYSTYEWEKCNNNNSKDIDKRHFLPKNGLKGGSNRVNGNKRNDESSNTFDFGKMESSLPEEKEEQPNSTSDECDFTENLKTASHPDDNEHGQNRVDAQEENSRRKLVTERDESSASIASERKEEEGSSHSSSWESSLSDLLLALPSFDYSHIIEGHNDMVPNTESQGEGRNSTPSNKRSSRRIQQQNSIFPTIIESPEEKKEMEHIDRTDPPALELPQKFFHGVPTFLSSLSQVHITKVSAHPLGAHVLMISEEALLFSYGLNNHGQLGIGFKSDINNKSRGFHITPTLITPVLENGGKAINCAAGLDHSLIVIATEGRRLQKLQTKPGVAYSDHGADSLMAPDSPRETSIGARHQSADFVQEVDERFHFSEKSVQYHQVYGFGRNNFMKLGLVRPNVAIDSQQEHADDVVLPRRVAMHCTVWPQEGDMDPSLPPQGIFEIAASAEHSAALVRRATGDIEVSMWGNASLGALGLPLNLDSQDIHGEIARRPFFKKSNISPLPKVIEKLSYRRNESQNSPFPTKISLGPYCSFIVMSNGKCMSCGFSAEGMLGQGFNKTHTMEPEEVFLPTDKDSPNTSRIVSVSAGAFHVIALSEDGTAYSWGINSNDRLGLGEIDFASLAHELPEKKENLVVIEWVPQKIDCWQSTANVKVKQVGSQNDKDNDSSEARTRIVLACAGYDCSMLVTDSGQVLSFGKRSGRLGKGEISSNVNTPQPAYGGLHLFHHRKENGSMKPSTLARPKRQRHASASITE